MIALMVRHGSSESPDVLGRREGANLTREGQEQAKRIPELLAMWKPSAIYASPLQRTLQTADVLGRALRLQVQISEALTEMDFGEWEGKTPNQLAPLSAWQKFNQWRSQSRCPGGEAMEEVQQRVVSFLQQLNSHSPDSAVVCVSHADVIRAALCHYLGLSLDDLLSLDVAPGSMRVVQVR